jgi:hypothetical protein
MEVTWMMATVFIPAVSVLMLAAAANAHEGAAQPVPIARWESTVGEAQRRQLEARRTYAHCLVQHRRRIAEEMLAAVPDSPAMWAVVPRLVQNGYCFHQRHLRSRPHELRGALAEALYERGATGGELRPIQPFERSFEAFRETYFVNPPRERSPDAQAAAEQILRARWVALCLVRREPDGARALLGSDLASPVELQSLLALSESITSCGAGGPPLAVNRNEMRQLVAEALYTLRQ